jgi:hypothetical protein
LCRLTNDVEQLRKVRARIVNLPIFECMPEFSQVALNGSCYCIGISLTCAGVAVGFVCLSESPLGQDRKTGTSAQIFYLYGTHLFSIFLMELLIGFCLPKRTESVKGLFRRVIRCVNDVPFSLSPTCGYSKVLVRILIIEQIQPPTISGPDHRGCDYTSFSSFSRDTVPSEDELRVG